MNSTAGDKSSVPRHVGYILDGNRRWAKQQGLQSMDGHKAGYETLRQVFDDTVAAGVEYVSLFVFSTENWSRTKKETDYLMGLIGLVFNKYVKELKQNGIRVHWLGSEEHLGKKELKIIKKAVEETKHLTKGNLCLCLNYGGHQEIVDAVKNIVESGVDSTKITAQTIAENLYAPEVPDIDLLVRTSGEQRLSNFMLWRVAYSELLFIDKYWPAMTTQDVHDALNEFAARQRRFGS